MYFRRDGMKSYRLSKFVLHDVQIHHSAINDEFIVVIPNFLFPFLCVPIRFDIDGVLE